ncbi:MAG TPA: YdcF family protein [Sphingomonas sp.]|uniref:YdcF family protein n=1 Tax=Sphingomonas sp. TaxID=28214 RepID=UPI002C1A3F53|nr:YdcF family protein [Sphingomonas sp.]HMI19566.1 YdcF family protein [Sphingomonas sp.]
MIRRLFSALVLLWALGFVWFAIDLPRPAGTEKTDGIVVLTGGPGRIQRGLDILKAGHAQRMLVSGVDRRVRPVDLVETYHVTPALLADVDLGRSAVDTRSNALETRRWIADHHYGSIRLVTTDWHMRRARFELRQVMQGITVVPDAVPSEPDLLGLLREYHKYLLRRGAALIGR